MLAAINLGWFDMVLALVMSAGLILGRSRGMSAQLPYLLKWIAIISLSALLYRPVSTFFQYSISVGVLWCNILAYLTVASLVALVFNMIKNAKSAKLSGSDAFGNMEYFMGMAAGALHYFCFVMLFLALLNAKLITASDRLNMKQFQRKNFEGVSFPTIGSIQQSVFEMSLSGRLIHQYLGSQLIEPARSSSAGKRLEKRRDPTDSLGF